MNPVIPEKSFFSRKFSCVTVTAILVMIIVVGITIMIPCGVDELGASIRRAKQYTTQTNMKSLALPLEKFKIKTGHYPIAKSIDELIPALVPDFLSQPADKDILDGWRNPFRYHISQGDPTQCKPGAIPQSPACGPLHYTLASAGLDGKFSHENLAAYTAGETEQAYCDIVMRDGEWLRQPVGKQHGGACRSE